MLRSAPPPAVLFACNLNSIRSPIAEGLARRRFAGQALVSSCGIWEGGYLDEFMVEVMREVGVDMSHHAPKTFEEIDPGAYDLIVALTSESRVRAETLAAAHSGLKAEHWILPDPTADGSTREERLEAYRQVREALQERIAARFAPARG